MTVEESALSWLHTPFHPMARQKGVGCDCLGLILGVYEEQTGQRVALPFAYSSQWHQTARQGNALLAALAPIAEPVCRSTPMAADVLVFALNSNHIIHAGIMLSGERFLHAVADPAIARVVASPLDARWRYRLYATYKLKI